MSTLLYCVEIKIDRMASEEWLDWMKSTHIPDVLKTGLFQKAECFANNEKFSEKHKVFEIQYHTTSEDLEVYRQKHATQLQKDHIDRFKGNFEAHRRILISKFNETYQDENF